MKKKSFKPILNISILFCLFFTAQARLGFSQTYAIDTLAIRVILDQNGHVAIPVASVSFRDSNLDRIIKLDLSGKKISTLGSEIGSLSALTTLILSNNLIDSLPNEIWSLINLSVFDLSNNNLKTVNTGIGKLKNLLYLNLRSNGLTSIPLELFTLGQLDILILNGNSLETLSDDIINLSFLSYLDLSNNLIASVPLALTALNQLDSLDLSGNALTTLPFSITNFTSTKVYLADNQLCDLTVDVEAWANKVDPNWKITQACGIAIRPGSLSKRVKYLFVKINEEKVFIEFPKSNPGNSTGMYEIRIRNIFGRVVYQNKTMEKQLTINRRTFANNQNIYVELRSNNQLIAIASLRI